jgi:hypothetical protein
MRAGQLNVLSWTVRSTGCGARSVHRLNVTSGTARTRAAVALRSPTEVVEDPVHLHDEGDMALAASRVPGDAASWLRDSGDGLPQDGTQPGVSQPEAGEIWASKTRNRGDRGAPGEEATTRW